MGMTRRVRKMGDLVVWDKASMPELLPCAVKYTAVWSLKRGAINETLTGSEHRAMLDADRAIQSERDPDLSIEEVWRLQGRECGYERKRRVMRHDASGKVAAA